MSAQQLPEASYSTYYQTVAGQCSGLVETANLHFPCERYPEGLGTEHIWG